MSDKVEEILTELYLSGQKGITSGQRLSSISQACTELDKVYLERMLGCVPEEKEYSPYLLEQMVNDGIVNGFNKVFQSIRENALAEVREAITKELGK